MNQRLYLNRIGIDAATLQPNAETLALLLRGHLLHVPFENISIHRRQYFELDPDAFYRKIVLGSRGGYCYECNGLFAQLLQSLGFTVKLISGRVVQRNMPGPPYDHLSLIVHVDGAEWLVDAGFGDLAMKPLLLGFSDAQHDGRQQYRIGRYDLPDDDAALCVEKWSAVKKQFQPVYAFSTTASALEDFRGMNHYHQTSPESHFTRSLICSMPTESGRLSLINNRLITTSVSGFKEEQMLYSDAAVQEVLSSRFGIAGGVLC